MTRDMIEKIVGTTFEVIRDYINETKELNELVRNDYWLSGSSTYVYPYEIYLRENRYCYMEIQLDVCDKRKTNKLINHLKKMFNIPNLEYQLNTYDGSRCWDLTIYYNLS